MAGKLVAVGRVPALTAQLAWLNTLEFGLFTNDVAIAESTVMGDLSEAAWLGYARATPASFITPVLDGTLHAVSTATAVGFSNSSGGGVTYRGWFFYDPTAAVLVAAENFGADIPIADGGVALLVPGFTDTSEF